VLNLLVITTQKDARKRISGLLTEGTCRLTFKPEVATSQSLVQQGLFDAILIAPTGTSEHTLDEIRAIRRARAETPIAIIVESAPLAWEESALASGADIILREPLAPLHLERALQRMLPVLPAPQVNRPMLPSSQTIGAVSRGALEILRDFSHILGYSLDHKMFAEQFVRKVRDIVGVSRIAVFLEKPQMPHDHGTLDDRLSCATAIGIPPDVIECFELSRSAGIGSHMVHSPQILQADNEHSNLLTAHDVKAQREFEILGCRVAVPISDRTRTIGVAMIGSHVTGRLFNSDELQLLFLLMEELGSAIRNTWLHQELTASHRLLADVLAALSSGCLVVNKELQVRLNASSSRTCRPNSPARSTTQW
jgi:CheY-like chemotaxis protein